MRQHEALRSFEGKRLKGEQFPPWAGGWWEKQDLQTLTSTFSPSHQVRREHLGLKKKHFVALAKGKH